jgi:hypothetical protein
MSNVIEKFAIAFGFDGKEALKGIDQTEKGLTKVKKASKATSPFTIVLRYFQTTNKHASTFWNGSTN